MVLDIKGALRSFLSDEDIEEIDEYVDNMYGGNYEKYIADLIIYDHIRHKATQEPIEDEY